MHQVFYIVLGAALTAASSVALGRLLLRRLSLRLYRQEETLFALAAGSAVLSLVVFGAAALRLASKGLFLGVAAAALAAAWRYGAWKSRGPSLPPLPPAWRCSFWAIYAVFSVVYLANAMAPEISPDGSSYHLGLVAKYHRDGGFTHITTNMYANLSQGVEMLFLFAYAIGRHSAAAMVHLAFLMALPLAMLAWARRRGIPRAGVIGALLVYASPVVGVDGVSAYNDVALAFVLFSVFHLMDIWAEERARGALLAAALLAGFAYAIKYTGFIAFPYVLVTAALRLHGWREPVVKSLLIPALVSLIPILPWLVKNALLVHNPFSPFFNRFFPNPFVHVQFEAGYFGFMRHYGLDSWREWPLELTVRGGKLGGMLGAVYLAAPLALLALRERLGRRLLLAALVFAATYPANVGTRFMVFPLPFISLAMGLALEPVPVAAAAVALTHAWLSWPPMLNKYAPPVWRLGGVPHKYALRLRPEEEYLNARLQSYPVVRIIESKVKEGERVLAFNQIAEAYTKREVLVSFQSAEGDRLADIFYTPVIEDFKPTRQLWFRFAPRRLRRIRVAETSSFGADRWSVTELRVYRDGRELPRLDRWRLTAKPNPWDVQMAFDNSPATRWQAWRPRAPGMFVEINFGGDEEADALVLECTRDQPVGRLRVEGDQGDGRWQTLAQTAQERDAPPPAGLRRAAAEELLARGVHYLVLFAADIGASDVRINAGLWGMTLIDERAGIRLYRIEREMPKAKEPRP